MDNNANNHFNFLIAEFEKLKEEQHKRIEFRDHMIYLTLAAIGGVFSFALEKKDFNFTLLVLPFLCTVLGWTYLGNDEKISAISKYIRIVLIPKFKSSDDDILLTDNWEEFLRNDQLRRQRKIFQLLVDLSIFCFSGVISLVAFFILHKGYGWYFILIAIFESLLILFLSIQFIKYADTGNK